MYLIAAPWKMPMLLYTLMFFQVNFSLDFKQFFKLPPSALICFDLSFHFHFHECAHVCVCVLAFPSEVLCDSLHREYFMFTY